MRILPVPRAIPLLTAFVICASFALGAPSAANAQLFFSQDGNPNGLYALDTTSGAAVLVGAGASGVSLPTVGLSPSGVQGLLFGSTFDDIARIRTDGSSAVVLPGSAAAEGLAFCAGSGTFYGTLNDPFSSSFFTIDTATGVQLALLAPPPEDVEGLACDPVGGRIYGIGDTTNLLVYNIVGDNWSVVGDTGINWDAGGLAFDPAGILYAVGQGGGDNLYTINPLSAAATLVGATGVTPTQGGLAFITVPNIIAVPALSPLGLMVLAVLLAGLAWVMMRGIRLG